MCVIEEIFACGHRGVQGNKKCHDVHCAKGKSTHQHYDCAWCDPERKSLAMLKLKKQPSLDMGGVMKKNMAADHGLTATGEVMHSKSAIWKEARKSVEEARRSGEGEAGASGPKKDQKGTTKEEKRKSPKKGLFDGWGKLSKSIGTKEKTKHPRRKDVKNPKVKADTERMAAEDDYAEELEAVGVDAPVKGDTRGEGEAQQDDVK